MNLETINDWACFGGRQKVLRHHSKTTGTPMVFSIFLPKNPKNKPLPVLYWLSGLTCNWENFTTKAGVQRYASEAELIIVAPDTSPRGDHVPDDPAYDFGQGAGFYVDATQSPWAEHFKMFSYVVDELPALVAENFSIDPTRRGIFGHSMGGHGALTIALRHHERYRSVSAFSPIVAPCNVPWGQKAFSGYLGENQALWQKHDACALVQSCGWPTDILIDQGEEDDFLESQLKTHLFAESCQKASIPATIRMQPGYDHSYYFIASFISDHIKWHGQRLRH